MALLDHFRPPLAKRVQWNSFHSQWAGSIVHHLNTGQLPPNYVAGPNVKLGIFVESDVGTAQIEETAEPHWSGVATLVYAPPKPLLVAPVDFADLDLFEVQVFLEDGGAKLVAVVELVSPANKDRPASREAFVRKCATYLQEGVSVVLVDVVTNRSGDFHADLVRVLAKEASALDSSLYAVAYRTLMRKRKTHLEAWPTELHLGDKLPTLPLWLAPDLAIPLNLQQTYQTTCASLRIPQG